MSKNLRRSHTIAAIRTSDKLKEIKEEIEGISKRMEGIDVDESEEKGKSDGASKGGKGQPKIPHMRPRKERHDSDSSEEPESEFDSWSAITRKCQEEKAKRLSVAEPELRAPIHTMSTGYTQFAASTLSAKSGSAAEVNAEQEVATNTRAAFERSNGSLSLKKRESLKEMAGLPAAKVTLRKKA